ncbi:hypothetical protein JXJ21_11940 [candidate division KSB1 bacterium]|nr:hypothetical protein [candidate division KSB1 bacterium]
MRSKTIVILLISCTLSFRFSMLQAQQALVINEFMADNDQVVIDTTDNHAMTGSSSKTAAQTRSI